MTQISTGARADQDPTDGWKKVVATYRQPSTRTAALQLVNSVGLYVLLWLLMALTVTISWWLTLPIAALAGAVLVRVFIIFHDCGHGSFLASHRANSFWGRLTGVLVFTPYAHWRGQHAAHHGTTGNLDRRGAGDVWTMTVKEYFESPARKRFVYRFARNPFVLLCLAPVLLFVLGQRVPSPGTATRERRSVWWTNVGVLGMATAMSLAMGLVPYLIIQLTVFAVAGAIGVWLFYLQHQFEDAYWEQTEDWNFVDAALKGSAFLDLPRVLQWFTGNIGYHHIHHLDSKIPNYRLQACHDSHPMFRRAYSITMFSSLKALRLGLWDEASKKLVRFGHAKRLRRQTAA